MSDAVSLAAGDRAPSFTLSDQDGNPVSLSDYHGKKTILYFYPAASTPGCTTEACDFRDNLNSLVSERFTVLGISQDDLPALTKFRDDEQLTFPLLSDPRLDIHKAYGAWGEKSLYGRTVVGTIRSTFVIDESQRIAMALYNVKATGHVTMLRKRLGLTLV